MINPNELRKGNLISFKGKIMMVSGIEPTNNGIYLEGDDRNFSLEVPMPIPLTPEWLEKCGFEKTTALVDRYEIPFKDSGHIFMNEGENVLKIEVEYIPIELEHIKYVHQLQNLYLDLTGKELIIKESALHS